MQYLSASDILAVHFSVVAETGGSHGLRDRHALATLEDLPKQKAFGKEMYPTVFHKAAVYARNIIFGHPFVDGNKRTAMASADVFLQLNGSEICAPQGQVEAFALSIISEKRDLEHIAMWLKEHSEKLKKKGKR